MTMKKLLCLSWASPYSSSLQCWLLRCGPRPRGTSPPRPTANSKALVDKGRYLAQAGDCVACHTSPGGAPFAGGLPLSFAHRCDGTAPTCADRGSGIGNYTLADFDRAVLQHPDRRRFAVPRDALSVVCAHERRRRSRAVCLFHARRGAGPNPRRIHAAFPGRCRCAGRWRCGARHSRRGRMQWRSTPPAIPDISVARGAYASAGPGALRRLPYAARADDAGEGAGQGPAPSTWPAVRSSTDGWRVNLRGNPAGGLKRLVGRRHRLDLAQRARNASHAVVGGAVNRCHRAHARGALSDDDLKAIAAFLKALPPSARSPWSFSDTATTAGRRGAVAGRQLDMRRRAVRRQLRGLPSRRRCWATLAGVSAHRRQFHRAGWRPRLGDSP